jgi:hypothetical protein
MPRQASPTVRRFKLFAMHAAMAAVTLRASQLVAPL